MAFEAVFIGLLLITSLALVNSMTTPPPAMTSDRAPVELATQDALTNLAALNDPDYGTKLQRVLVECLNGDATTFQALMKRILPVGAGYRLIVDQRQGADELVVCDSGKAVARETVSYSLPLWGWEQDAAFVVPEYRVLDAADMGMRVDVVPLRNGYPELAFLDTVLQVEVLATNQPNLTTAQPLVVRDGPQLTAGILVNGAPVTYVNDPPRYEFTLRWTEHAGTAVPAGTMLTLRLPRWWSDVETPPTTAWSQVTTQRTPDAWIIQAKLALDLVAGSVDFAFNGTKPDVGADGAFAFDTAEASLGTYGTAPLVFRGKGATPTLPTPVPRSTALASSHFARPGTSLKGTLAVVNADPVASTFDPLTQACLTSCLELSGVRIREAQGRAVFTNPLPADWTWEDTTTIRWTPRPNVRIGADQGWELALNLPLADTLSGADYSLRGEYWFPSGNHTNATQLSNLGVLTARFHPDLSNTTGYTKTNGDVCAGVHVNQRLLQGCAPYETTPSLGFQAYRDRIATASWNSTLTIRNSTSYRPGDWVTVHADFSAFGQTFATDTAYEASAKTRITLYHPWMPRNTSAEKAVPWWSVVVSPSDATGSLQLPKNLVYGTYVVVAEHDFRLVNGAQAQPGEDPEVNQTARKVAWFTVGKEARLERTYFHSVAIVAWMPDWA